MLYILTGTITCMMAILNSTEPKVKRSFMIIVHPLCMSLHIFIFYDCVYTMVVHYMIIFTTYMLYICSFYETYMLYML